MSARVVLALALLAGGFAASAQEPAPATPAASAGSQAVTEAMRRLARERNAEGLQAFEAHDYPVALAAFRAAFELDPDNPEIINNLAYLFQLLGNREEAERLYGLCLERDPDRAVAHFNLGELLAQPGASQERLASAAAHLARARELRGNTPDVIVRQARVAAARGQFAEAERFYADAQSAGGEDARFLLETAGFYLEYGHEDEAIARLRRVRGDAETSAAAARKLWEIELDRQARRWGWRPQADAVTPQARALAANGRVLAGQGRLREAEELLRRALELAPAFAAAHADLGDVLRAEADLGDAELAFLRAIALDSGNAELYARLGRFYLDARARPRAREAALFLSRALELKPEWTSLHRPLAEALRAAGNVTEALRHLDAYLAGTLGDEERASAESMRAVLAPAGAAVAGGVTPSPSTGRLGRVHAHLARGELDAAMAALDGAAAEAGSADVQEVRARILRAAGRLAEAEESARLALAARPDHGPTEYLLGAVLLDEGRAPEAERHLERARALGELAAACELARLRVGDGQGGLATAFRDVARLPALAGARRELAAFVDAGPASAERDRAATMATRVSRRLRAALAILILLAAAGAGAGVMAWRRVRGGADVRLFLTAHPDRGHEVVAVLSAIRHEVLKHNTMVLSGVIHALERGDADASDKALHFARSLRGAGDENGVIARLRRYTAELERLAAAAGMRLNLGRRDAALAPLLAGFGLLERALPALECVPALGDRERARLRARLELAWELLGERAQAALGDLLHALRTVTVDASLLAAVFAGVRREPAFTGAGIAAPAIAVADGGPWVIAMPRDTLEDVLSNLIRNAVESSLRTGALPVAVGLAVAPEIDAITGIERVRLVVSDASPEELAIERVRGQAIDHGLGLARDLVARYDGSLAVAAPDGRWRKSVMVRVPRAAVGEET